MKILLKIISAWIGRLGSHIYPVLVSNKVNLFGSIIYTSWLSRSFQEFGTESIVAFPCCLLGGQYVRIGQNVRIGKNSVINAWDRYEDEIFKPTIQIGHNTLIGEYTHISAIHHIHIGENVLIGRWFTVVDNSHGGTEMEDLSVIPLKRRLQSKGGVKICDNVWIGDKVTVVAGVTIGKNCIVGANSVITKDVSENCLVAGNPGQVRKKIE